MSKLQISIGVGTLLAAVVLVQTDAAPAKAQAALGRGMLVVLGKDGPGPECPLKHTDVKADISGFIARVRVSQDFENRSDDKVEAVYVFPLPHDSAVDSMTMFVGKRIVKGVIKPREEAQAIYDAARAAGKVASLLDQERPNIFTQHVANIAPGAKVRVEISYVQTLRYEVGSYDFSFPMVVGPRYMPGNIIGRVGGGWSNDTDRVPDASRISPPVAIPGTRAGHDISVSVTLDAGLPLDSVSSPTHEVSIDRPVPGRATVQLKSKTTIPNKDFVLRYDVAARRIQDAVLAHKGEKGGFFTLVLQPPELVSPAEITPKELIFVLDTSGSMSGFPIEKAKETMHLAMEGLNPQDTFNLITFAGDTHVLFPKPVPATPENLAVAKQFLSQRSSGGGTEMMKAIAAALDPTDAEHHIRVVCFMTDGYVGNEEEIIAEVKRHTNTRVFSFGIGSSINRYLLDKMAEAGRGEVEYVGLQDDGSAAAKRFHERVRNPLLTDIAVEYAGLPVSDVYPARVPDLFSAKPLVLTGRYQKAAKGSVRIRGKLAGKPYVRDIPVELPEAEGQHDVLGTLWARLKVDSLTHSRSADSKNEITKLGLSFNLMTQFTSFVAVEETTVTEGGVPRKVQVPVESPEGFSYGDALEVHQKTVGVAQLAATGTRMYVQSAGSPALHIPVGPPAREVLRIGDVQRPSKLHPVLKGSGAAAFVKNGTIRVQVFLKQFDAAAMEQLKRAGLHVTATPGARRMVIGFIALDKLRALETLDIVTYISPAP